MGKSNPQKYCEYENCLVIGGLGLLGYEIAEQLYSAGKKVRIMDIAEQKELDAKGFEFFKGDIRNKKDLRKACEGMDTIFQTAAAVWDPKTPSHIYDEVNVWGNKNVIEACLLAGVKRLVYTSTLDVVVDGKKPIKDGDERLDYPAQLPRDHYSRTKIIAEKMILKANSKSLLTCSLRPVGMYGPRDKYHIANIIRAVKNGADFKLGN
ncbi:MAG: NAD-dependent epimerase/dehydratase family protein, partial [Actinobacteria bacterium]|nr:NAD-dependent epimerase/dehydratase family protein [Actinomycetota bacterium]